MKTSIWDILTGVILLGILCMIGAFGAILVNPNVGFNIFKPSAPEVQVVPTIAIPSVTPTSPGLPPTWTPSPIPQDTEAPSNNPSLKPSSTPLPTNTFVVLPTFTPSKTPRTGVGGGTCLVTYQNPTDNSTLPKDTQFTMRWTIKNTSKDVWRADSVDIRFDNTSDRLHVGNDVLDLPFDVAAGGMIDITIPMRTPSKAGAYVTNWSLNQGSKSVCKFYVQLSVKEK